MAIIANLLQEKAVLTPEQATVAEQVIAEHIAANVPAEFQGIVGSVLGVGAAAGQPAAESGGLGGLLGEATKLFGR